MSSVMLGTFGGLIAALATTIGAVPALFKTRKGFSLATHLSLDFALGMMLAAASVSLILPASQKAIERGGSAFMFVMLSIFIGASFIKVLGDYGARFQRSNIQNTRSFKSVARSATSAPVNSEALIGSGAWLFIVAMMLHNLPEGIASGAALAGLSFQQALPVLGAIALQNLPEGLTTVVAFQALGAPIRTAFLGALASAGVELFGGVIGGVLLQAADQLLPYLLSFAGGAMLFVAGREALERWTERAARMQVVRDLTLGMGFMTLLSHLLPF